MVSWVPGSPIDWAADDPTASRSPRAPGGEAQPVAGRADAVALLTGEDGADPDGGDGRFGGDGPPVGAADEDPGSSSRRRARPAPAVHLDRVGQHPAEDPVPQVADGRVAALARTDSTMPRSVAQSWARTMTSWDTSTSAGQVPGVGGAQGGVGQPLRAPWVEMKYSSTVRPSRKLARIGRGMMSPRGWTPGRACRRSGSPG